LKLKCDEPLSNVAFNFNVRRYIMEREDPTVIVSANIGRQSGAETRADGSKVFFNTPFKWTRRDFSNVVWTGPENEAGRDVWCNAYVIENDNMFAFAANAPAAGAGVSRPGLCPAAPDPAAYSDGVAAEELAEEVGKSGKYATVAIIMTKKIKI
jgi:hypothetical protein